MIAMMISGRFKAVIAILAPTYSHRLMRNFAASADDVAKAGNGS